MDKKWSFFINWFILLIVWFNKMIIDCFEFHMFSNEETDIDDDISDGSSQW